MKATSINISFQTKKLIEMKNKRAQINRRLYTVIRWNNFLNLINWIELFEAEAFESVRAKIDKTKRLSFWG